MNRDGFIQYLKMLDANLKKPAKLYIYGGAALMLLEEETRISLDIDVAAPYFDQVRQARSYGGTFENGAGPSSGSARIWVRIASSFETAGSSRILSKRLSK